MEEVDSTASEAIEPTYLQLLREINELTSLFRTFQSVHGSIEETVVISQLEAIFKNLTANMRRISQQTVIQQFALFIISIFNTIIRISALNSVESLVARESFQSLVNEVQCCIWLVGRQPDHFALCATHMLDSMFLNLIKDDFIEVCFKQLLSSVTTSTIDAMTTVEESSTDYRYSFHTIVADYMQQASQIIGFMIIPSEYEFRNKYQTLMASLQKFLDTYFENASETVTARLIDVVVGILNLIWNLSDKIPILATLVKVGYVQKAIQWIRTGIFVSHIDQLGDPLVSIVHNLSRNKEGLEQLRKAKAFEALVVLKEKIIEGHDADLLKHFRYALVALSTSDELLEDDKRFILESSEMFYQLCQEADRNPEWRCEGCHLSEFLGLLNRAFTNTYVMRHILEKRIDGEPTPLESFAKLFLSMYGVLLDPEPDGLQKDAADYLMRILLKISSYPEYITELIDNTQFCIIMQSLANRPKHGDAKRIWCNIQQIRSLDQPSEEKASMIYISYDNADMELCKEFVKELHKKTALPIWVDYQKVEPSDDNWEYLSSIIKSATIVITLLSTAYVESADKSQELSYIVSTNNARDARKGLVIVTTEPDFNFTRSWMKELLHDKMFIPYKDDIPDLVLKVCNQIGITKKPLFESVRSQFQAVFRKRPVSEELDVQGSSEISISTVGNEFCAALPKSSILKKSSRISEETEVLVSAGKKRPLSVASLVITETGSAGSSTWV